ncbi:hypothetical protein ACJJTC_002662 [Scirpophaga incertulas]
MEFSEIVVKDNPGLCRCCLSEGCYKDMGSDYTWMNETEIYADMLLECFDISISQHNEGPNGPNRLICEVCITRLRDACYFKKQVLDSEKKFVDMVGRGEFKSKVVVYQTQMKAETAEEAAARAEDTDGEYLDDDMAFVDDELDQKHDESEVAASSVTADPLPVRNKRGRPKKATTTKSTKKKVKVEKNKNKALVKGQSGQRLPTGNKVEDVSSKNIKMAAMRQNVFEVITMSTVTPFLWLKSVYRCFYCYEVFHEPDDLKEHQIVHTNDEEKWDALKNHWEPTVYVDVSNIACSLCPMPVEDIFELIDHLIDDHDMPFNKKIGTCMTPFKLKQLTVQCVPCGKDFMTFAPLLNHTNRYHLIDTEILCELCGQKFKSRNVLREHRYKEHSSKSSSCTICGEDVHSITRMRTHMQKVHNKRYKCFHCPELFDSLYKRTSHLVNVHKEREEISCPHCPKKFIFRSMMVRHVRDRHMQEKNNVCSICGFRSFGNNRMKNHMLKHSAERNVKCPVCDKAFKTEKTMKQHFNNIHQKTGVMEMVVEELNGEMD